MSSSRRLPWVSLALLASLGACMPTSRTAFSPRAGAVAQPPTVIEVVNRATLDMNIYALPEVGIRERLGTATGLTTTRFVIPSRLIIGVTSMAFAADPVGSTREFASDRIAVVPGDTVVFEIPPD